MPKLRHNIPLPIIGIDVSKPGEFLDQRSTPDCQNVEITRSVIQKRNGTVSVGATGSERIMALIELDTGVTNYFIRIGLDEIFQLNKVTEAWSDITGSDLTGADTDRISHAYPLLLGSKILVFTNGIDNIRKYTGTGNTADLGGSPPKAKFCVSYNSYLVIANVGSGSYPHRVQWSDTGDCEEWAAGNAGYVDLIEDPQPISGLNVWGDYVSVHKDNAIYLGYLVSTSEVFRFDRKPTGVGTCCNATIQNLKNGSQIFLAKDGIRLFNGVTAPLIESPIMDELREGMNPEYLYKAWSVVVAERDEYWVAIPMGSDTEPNTIYKYNYRTGQIYKDRRENISACGLMQGEVQATWNDKTNTWDSDTTRWDYIEYSTLNPIVMFGDTSGQVTKKYSVYSDDDEIIESYWISKEYTAQDLGDGNIGQLVRWSAIQVWAAGNGVSVYYSTDSGQSWIPITTLTLTSDYPSDDDPLYGWFDVVSSRIMFKLENNVAGESFSFKKFFVEANIREMRR